MLSPLAMEEVAAYFAVNSPQRSIVLIGFMGTGKSSVGRQLASSLGWQRFDLDELITSTLGRAIEQIFAEFGERHFRGEETALLEKIGTDKPAIIVTGGGVVLQQRNVRRLRQLGTIVCLTADFSTLLMRLERRSDRPLLRTNNLAETVQFLLREREPLYQQAADFIVDTSALTHAQVAQSILNSLALNC